jgi:hypothetical protein
MKNIMSAQKNDGAKPAWLVWFNGLKNEVRCGAGTPLERESKIVGRHRIVRDGPFAESKENIAHA